MNDTDKAIEYAKRCEQFAEDVRWLHDLPEHLFMDGVEHIYRSAIGCYRIVKGETRGHLEILMTLLCE